MNSRVHSLRLLAPLACAALLPAPASAQGIEQDRVLPSSSSSNQYFGVDVGVDSGWMISGASGDDTHGTDAGCAFLFRWDTATENWVEHVQLFPSDPEAGAAFGRSVAISGDVLAIGSSYEDNTKGTDAGSVYVFRRNTSTDVWSQEQKLIATSGAASDLLGSSLALRGTALIAGAPQSDAQGSNSGAAYVFKYKNSFVKWVEEARLDDPNGAANDQAGLSVGIDGNLAIVGSPYATVANKGQAGSAGVFSFNGTVWSQQAELTAVAPEYYDDFGYSVAISGTRVAVGAPYQDLSAPNYDVGAVSIFDQSGTTWNRTTEFLAPTTAIGTNFGFKVALRGDLLAVGSLWDSSGIPDHGAVHLFRYGRNAWHQDVELGPSDKGSYDRFGFAIALDGLHLVVGAYVNNYTGGTGVVYGYFSPEITLDITPSQPAPGAPVDFKAFYGVPGEPVMLALVDVEGTPFFLPILIYVFGSDGSLTINANAPSPLAGVNCGFRAYKISSIGWIAESATEHIDL